MEGDTLAIMVAIIGSAIALWRVFKAETNRLHEDMRSMKSDIGDLRERMARVEGVVETLRDTIAGRQAS